MTPVGETALDSLHQTATEIFTGALAACNIASAFDRRLRFEGNTLHRLMPDGSGPATIDLSNYKRIFVISIGKAAAPMLETLLDRMKRRQGLRGICCAYQAPRHKNWRFRYFEGGHPLPNEDSFAAARATLAMLKKARKDTLVFYLISGGGSAMFDLPIDPHITLEETREFHQLLLASGAPINEINTLRKHFSAVKGGRLALAAPEAAKISLLLPDVPLRTLDALSSGPTSPDHSTVEEVRELIARYKLADKFPPSVRAYFERNDLPESPGNKSWLPPFFPKAAKAEVAPPPPIAAGALLKEEDPAFRDSVFEILLSSHDLIENARAQAERAGYHNVVDNSCDDWDYADAARSASSQWEKSLSPWTVHPEPEDATSSSPWPARSILSNTRASGSPCSAPAPTASTETPRLPAPLPTPQPLSARTPSDSTSSPRWPPSTPVPCSPPSATRWSPGQPVRTCATCACSSPNATDFPSTARRADLRDLGYLARHASKKFL